MSNKLVLMYNNSFGSDRNIVRYISGNCKGVGFITFPQNTNYTVYHNQVQFSYNKKTLYLPEYKSDYTHQEICLKDTEFNEIKELVKLYNSIIYLDLKNTADFKYFE